MAGHTPWKVLMDRLPPERRERIRIGAEESIEECREYAEFEKRGLTPEAAAQLLGAKRPVTADLDCDHDIPLGQLSRLVVSIGGELEFVARLPDRELRFAWTDGKWSATPMPEVAMTNEVLNAAQ